VSMSHSTAEIPHSYDDVMRQKKALAHLATLMPDGTPQVTPVWFDVADGMIRINTARGRVKDRNMRKREAVALSITDPDNPYRHVAIRGRVTNITEQGADEHVDLLTKKYLGKEEYPFRAPGEVRVMYEIEPLSVSTDQAAQRGARGQQRHTPPHRSNAAASRPDP
jgi:PPOX class probable F420-dependent enzyme